MAGNVQVTKFKVTGMHCSSCSTAVQKALSVTTGVEKASVSLTLEQAEVVYDPSIVQEVTTQCLQSVTVMTTISAQSSHSWHRSLSSQALILPQSDLAGLHAALRLYNTALPHSQQNCVLIYTHV